MTYILPPPSDPQDNSAGAADGPEVRRRARRERKSDKLPTVDELLKQIQQINGMIALKFLTPQAATTMLGGLRTILDVQRERARQSQEQVATEALIAACRRDPQLITLLEPLLTDEQLDLLIKDTGEDTDGVS